MAPFEALVCILRAFDASQADRTPVWPIGMLTSTSTQDATCTANSKLIAPNVLITRMHVFKKCSAHVMSPFLNSSNVEVSAKRQYKSQCTAKHTTPLILSFCDKFTRTELNSDRSVRALYRHKLGCSLQHHSNHSSSPDASRTFTMI
jgi:hypothetical protein